MAIPQLKVEIAFDSGYATLDSDRTWTDVSEWAEDEVSINHGRADVLSVADPGQATFTLDNTDGRFTPGLVSSPYYPNVKKGKPVRLSVIYADDGGDEHVRFTGYINEWPLVWPDGTESASTVTVTASTRRARMGLASPLPSALRTAILASEPVSYWPLDDDIINYQGYNVFRDATNTAAGSESIQLLAAFFKNKATSPEINNGSLAPTDEASLVRFPDLGAVYDLDRYVGGSSVMKVNTGVASGAGEYMAEALVRVLPRTTGLVDVTPFRIGSTGMRQEVYCWAYDDGAAAPEVGVTIIVRDPDTGAILTNSSSANVHFDPAEAGIRYAPGPNTDTYRLVTDGQIHHWAINGYTSFHAGLGVDVDWVDLHIDGVPITGTAAFHGIDSVFTSQFKNVVIGNITNNVDLYAGHLAVYDRAFGVTGAFELPSSPEIEAHATAGTISTETLEERVVRIAGVIGVPEDEIDVETSIAEALGSQPEKGRSAAEVLDEAARSTGGIFYDTRDGRLAMQARNHRYNAVTEFTLDAELQEVEGNLEAVLDDRYLVNSIEVSRTGKQETEDDLPPEVLTDDASIEEYGIYATSLEVASASDAEVQSAGYNMLARYAEPIVRISRVGVDLGNLDEDLRADLLTADIGTKFELTGLPAQAPQDPLAMFIEGYEETISAVGHSLEINTTPVHAADTVFVLDDETYGVLDSTTALVAY